MITFLALLFVCSFLAWKSEQSGLNAEIRAGMHPDHFKTDRPANSLINLIGYCLLGLGVLAVLMVLL